MSNHAWFGDVCKVERIVAKQGQLSEGEEGVTDRWLTAERKSAVEATKTEEKQAKSLTAAEIILS